MRVCVLPQSRFPLKAITFIIISWQLNNRCCKFTISPIHSSLKHIHNGRLPRHPTKGRIRHLPKDGQGAREAEVPFARARPLFSDESLQAREQRRKLITIELCLVSTPINFSLRHCQPYPSLRNKTANQTPNLPLLKPPKAKCFRPYPEVLNQNVYV